MGNFDDHIKNTFDGEEIPFNPEHWEQLKNRLNATDAPTPFEERAKDVFEAASVPLAAGAWDQFAQKLNEVPTPFEKSVQDKFAEAEVPYNESHWNSISDKINTPSGFNQKARDIFNSEKVPYNAKHWEQMEAMLDGTGQKGLGFFNWKNIAAAGALVLLGWLTYAALNNKEENKTAEKTPITNEQEVVSKAKQENTSNAASALEKKNVAPLSNEKTAAEQVSAKNKNTRTNNNKYNKDANSIANSPTIDPTVPFEKITIEEKENNDAISNNAQSTKSKKLFREIALADKNLIVENEETIDSLTTEDVTADWSGMIFKYATLPSSLPSSVLSNVWEQPAIAGIDHRTAVKFMYNSPWENKVIDRATNDKEFHLLEPANMYLSVDGGIGKNHKIGVGTYYHRIHNNDWQSDNMNLTLSYTHSINKFTQLRGGIGATYSHNALNTNNVNFWENKETGGVLVANDESVNNPEQYINYKTGLWLSHPLVFAGVTLDNLFQTTVTKKPDLQLASSAIAGVNVPVTKTFTATVYAKRVSTINALYTIGTMLSFNNKIFAGASYENSNYATITGGCNIKNQLRLHMSWGIMANKESFYINDTNKGFVTAGIRYLIDPSHKSSGPSL